MRTMDAMGGMEPREGRESPPGAATAAGDMPAGLAGHAARHGDAGIPPDTNVDNSAGTADGSANVDVGGGWLDGWDPFNVDNVFRRTAAPANVDKGPVRRAGLRLGPMPYHPPQPRPRIPLPEAEPEPQGTLADGLEAVFVDREAKGFWSEAARFDASVRADMATLGKALAALRATQMRSYATRTLKEYERALRRMGGRSPEDMAPGVSKRSAYVYRAALLHDVLARRLPEAVTAGRRAASESDVGKLAEAAVAARGCLAVLDRYPPDREHRTIHAPERAGDSFYETARAGLPEESLAPAKPGMGRRSVLGRFPPDWRSLIWKAVVRHRRIPLRHVAAVAVLTLVGLRPQEIENGVFVDATRDGEVALTVLKPAKSHGGRYGLGARTHVRLTGGRDDPAAWLHRFVRSHGGSATVTMRRRHLARLVGALSRRAMPEVDPPACPYDYRHQYSADAKRRAREAFPDDPEARQAFVAERMGHGSAKSQRAYGTSLQSKGGVRADEVEILDPAKKVRPARASTPMPSSAPAAPKQPVAVAEGLEV
jgi:hypothetical protein